MIYTTLNKIRNHHPCKGGWEKLLSSLNKTDPDDEPLSFKKILDSNGLNDAIWALRAVDGHDKEIRLFAVACARRVQHLMTDKRSINALDVAEKYANGECSKEELDAARCAARCAADAAWWAEESAEESARDAARDAAWWAARAAAAAAWSARDAAEAADGAARDAAVAAAWAANAAAEAAYAAARGAEEAELQWQTEEFKRVFLRPNKV